MLKCIHKIVTLLVDTLSILIHIQNYLADFFIGILDLKIYDVHKNEIQKAIATTIRAIFLRFVPNLLQFDCIISIIKIRKEQKN